MNINGVEFEFKLSNISHARKFQKAVDEMAEDEKKIKNMKNAKLEEVLGALKDMFTKFFITATGTDVIGACEDTDEMANMYNEFLEEIGKQKEKVLSPFSTNRIR